MNTQFWYVAGALTGFAAAVILMPLWRAGVGALANRRVRLITAGVAAAAFCAAVLGLYQLFGTPQALEAQDGSSPSAHPTMNAANAGQAADSMESAIARLEARLKTDGGGREDWLLLAQSYDFLGRKEEAEWARASAAAAGTGTASTVATANGTSTTSSASSPASRDADLDTLQKRTRSNPRDAAAWLALAARYRRDHEYTKAHEAFVQVAKLDGMTADAWADDADALGSLSGGSLSGEPARAIDRALALEPMHPKALWLKASLAHQEHRYDDALTVWKQLRDVLPPTSPDRDIIDNNIREATQLTSQAASPAAPAGRLVARDSASVDANADAETGSGEKRAGVQITGSVTIDARLASRISPGSTLFIYAKAADQPGPPLAVIRQSIPQSAANWPVSFRLDDSLAMMPGRRLSQFDKVIVEARVSRSGQATPASGDFYVTSAVLKPGERRKLDLTISREVG